MSNFQNRSRRREEASYLLKFEPRYLGCYEVLKETRMKVVFHLAILSFVLIGLTGCGRAKTDSQTSNPPPEAVTPAAAAAAPPAANVTAQTAPDAGVSTGAGRVDVSGVESAFRGAEGGAKLEADKVVAFARAGNYLDAWAHARKTMIKYPTTASQKKALEAMIAQLKPLLPPM
jgi:hypothetical protein